MLHIRQCKRFDLAPLTFCPDLRFLMVGRDLTSLDFSPLSGLTKLHIEFY
jgi:hypothetical protein